MELDGWSYLGAFAVSLILVLGLTPLALRLAVSREVLDHPGDYKTQDSPVPYLGGLAIVVSFSVAVFAATLINPPPSRVDELGVLLAMALVLSVMGLVDDLRGLSPVIRFVIEIGAAAAIWSTGVGVQVFANPLLDGLLTILWIVGVTNAINLLDNMDGLSAGIAAIAAGFFFILAAMNGQTLVAGLSVALSGCALGFLRTNFHPARIYMGDAGSLFIGFVLAVLGIKLRFVDAPQQIAFMVPVLVLGVAILDTTLVTVTRVKYGLNPFSGGRDHISHRLVFIGISVRSAVLLVYLAGVALGWLAIVMSRVDLTTGLILMGLVISVALFAGGMLGMIPVYEQSARRRMMLMEVLDHEDADARLSASN